MGGIFSKVSKSTILLSGNLNKYMFMYKLCTYVSIVCLRLIEKTGQKLIINFKKDKSQLYFNYLFEILWYYLVAEVKYCNDANKVGL